MEVEKPGVKIGFEELYRRGIARLRFESCFRNTNSTGPPSYSILQLCLYIRQEMSAEALSSPVVDNDSNNARER